MIGSEELSTRFTYHSPVGSQPEKYEQIRNIALRFATFIDQVCPDSREKSSAITALEESVMWANASIARRET
jgi:hypothetical protein